MKRRAFMIGVATAAPALPLMALGQESGRWRIAFLAGGTRPSQIRSSVYAGFLRGMEAHGHAEGADFVMEWRFAGGDLGRLPELAEDLLRRNVNVIVTGTPPAVPPLMRLTSTLPIVMGISYDPVASGLVASLARPGANVTGVAITSDVNVKQLDLLTSVVPKLSTAAILINPGNRSHSAVVEAVREVAKGRAITVLPVTATSPDEIEPAFAAMSQARADAFLVITDAFFLTQKEHIARLALTHHLPWIVAQREYVDAGGLMSYGQPLAESYRKAADFVDKLMKGAAPGDLPVEQPTVFELVVNLRTARELGVTVPQTLLTIADHVID